MVSATSTFPQLLERTQVLVDIDQLDRAVEVEAIGPVAPDV